MDKHEYEATLQQSYLVLSMAARLPVDEALQLARRSEAIGPVTDPTLWRENQHKLREDVEVMEAVNRLKQLAVRAGWQEGASKT